MPPPAPADPPRSRRDDDRLPTDDEPAALPSDDEIDLAADPLATDAADADPDALPEETPQHRRFVIRNDIRARLDVYLQNRLKGISRSRIQKLIDLGGVTVNDRQPKASTTIKTGDVIDVILPPQGTRRIEPEPIPLDVLYEDEHFIVLNKQAGVIVHPARSNLSGTLLNGLAYRIKQQVEGSGGTWRARQTRGFKDPGLEPSPASGGGGGQGEGSAPGPPQDSQSPHPDPLPRGEGGRALEPSPSGRGQDEVSSSSTRNPQPATRNAESPGGVAGLSSVGVHEFRPGIIHRLDKNTTGVIVVGKSDEAHWGIARQFENRSTLKAYLAVVHGNFDSVGGAVEQPIGKHPTIREAMAIRHDSGGRHALTLYRVREQYRGYALVELELKTGRTHQIRVHMNYLGHPIAGDILYGGEPVGRAELDAPPLPAARRYQSFAREKAEGQRMEAQALARPDLILAHPALHAALLRFTHPITQGAMTFTAPLHEPMATLMRELRKRRIEAPVAGEGWWVELGRAVPA